MMNSSFYISNIDCEGIGARIALKLGKLLNSFLSKNAFLYKNLHICCKLPIEDGLPLRSDDIIIFL